MKTYTFLAIGISVLFVACKKDLEPQESSIPLAATNAQTPVTPTPQQVQAQPQAVTAPGMNPPHGQPGHRCDIAVGTPLSQPIQTKPAQATSQPMTINANGQVVGQNGSYKVTQAPAQKVAPGMNPAHGQPGHRCDIAVGAPLNSPPGTGQKAAGSTTSAPISINSDGQVTGGEGKVKITRTDNNAPKNDVPALLQAPPPEPTK
ncbi:hypothetical protein [Flavobacterium silvaticum]|uniref:Uncharacterized protein n=1 Tax=Flavobacterium silvaticum TaxID=1852020 RepID=A0A972FKQ3_9FLAO|nr:hypothetical protein [Flavobacterium silvaticum]NMH27766.1 hypothetical protein [Flavobacterium silvaticum]